MAGKGNPNAGRRDNRRGQDRQRLFARWLRDTGLYPSATAVGQFPGEPFRSDLANVGERVVEVTLAGWDKTPEKLRQAEAAAIEQGLDEFMVWRHIGRGANEDGSVDNSVLIMRASVGWALLKELDQLRKDIRGMPAQDAPRPAPEIELGSETGRAPGLYVKRPPFSHPEGGRGNG